MKKNLFFVLFLNIMIGCVGPNSIQRRLNRCENQLGYLHDSPIANSKICITVKPEVLDMSDTTGLTIVNKDEVHLLFLVVYSRFEYHLTFKLGKRAFYPSLTSFTLNSFVKESERSGIYNISDSSSTNCYHLKIEILDYKVTAQYYKLDLGQSKEVEVKPSMCELKFKASLYDYNNNELFSRNYSSTKSNDFVKSRYYTENEILQGSMQNMTENLALCIKRNISKIVNDINAELNKKQSITNSHL